MRFTVMGLKPASFLCSFDLLFLKKLNSLPELYFRNPDPSIKHETLPDNHPRRAYRIDEESRIVAQTLSAWWIPEMRIMEEIDGTFYTVTDSYERTEMLGQNYPGSCCIIWRISDDK